MRGSRFHSSEWLRERLELLQRFCLPSLAGQTTDNFTWALFCDETTDVDALNHLREHSTEVPDLRLLPTSAERDQTPALRTIVDPGAEVLITTRLDSDDAISTDYVETVQEYAEPFYRSPHRDLLVNFPNGYRLDTRKDLLFSDWMNCSPFHSLFERPKRSPVQTVMHGGHARLHYEHLTQQDESPVRWLIVVHGNNMINKIRADMPRVEHPGPGVPGFSIDCR
jgi:hypothetical protein